uniref:Cleavage/polyadenylation specificity factor A subunit N-terminal domain-containing protein n=1 Tax=Mycena chlorophos TaxID=658473 RepID=A0ABQ0LPK8_MYCCL|nr:predicted protein [Mycena chlorophos]
MILLQRLLFEGAHVPHYLGPAGALGGEVLEKLVLRLTALRAATGSVGDSSVAYPAILPVSKLPLSVTWLRLVAGNWLFVAASDRTESQLLCYELSDLSSDVARTYLPGRVKTGRAEIQEGRVILALALGPEDEEIRVITLRKDSGGRNRFSELSRLQGSSHVLFLSGDVVGCAMLKGLSVPHLYDWKLDAVIDISAPPDGWDVPPRRAVPHLMTIWTNKLVIIRAEWVEVFDIHADNHITFRKRIDTVSIWEVDVCVPAKSCSESLYLLAITPDGIELLTLEELDGDVWLRRSSLVNNPEPIPLILDNEDGEEPDIVPSPLSYPLLYGLRASSSGQKMTWISAREASDPNSATRRPLYIYSAPILLDTDALEQTYTTLESASSPALWGAPCFDFDDALGLMVIGDCFGDIAVLDYAANDPVITRLIPDIAAHASPSSFLSDEPVSLSLLPSIYPGMPDGEAPGSRASRWNKFQLDIYGPWKASVYSSSDDLFFRSQARWEGVPCDDAWMLEHMYGVPGEVLPQAMTYDSEGGWESLVFRIGCRFFLYADLIPGYHGPTSFFSWPRNTLDPFSHTIQVGDEGCQEMRQIVNYVHHHLERSSDLFPARREENESLAKFMEECISAGGPRQFPVLALGVTRTPSISVFGSSGRSLTINNFFDGLGFVISVAEGLESELLAHTDNDAERARNLRILANYARWSAIVQKEYFQSTSNATGKGCRANLGDCEEARPLQVQLRGPGVGKRAAIRGVAVSREDARVATVTPACAACVESIPWPRV